MQEPDSEGFVRAAAPGSFASSWTEGGPCPACGQELRSIRGARSHWTHKHLDLPLPLEMQAEPAKVSASPTLRDGKPDRPSTPDLRQVQTELQESLETVGALVAGVLGSYKEFAITCKATGTMVQVPPLLQRGPLRRIRPFSPPYLETTVGHVIVEDAPLSAGIVMRYAERNPLLLRLVRGFNALVHVEGDAKVLVDHVAGLIHTAKPDHTMASWYLAHEREKVLQAVSEENVRLQAKIDQLQAQMQAQAAQQEERGAGSRPHVVR